MSDTKKKILVVDDDIVVQRTLLIKLKAANFDVIAARDGSAAVNAVRTAPPDAILLDISFPTEFGSVTWDGFGIMEWLRRTDSSKSIPIFFISSADPAKYADRVREHGALGYFRKPINHEELIAALALHFSSETAPAQVP